MGRGILVLTKLLDLMLGLTLYYFSFRMFREAIKEEVPPWMDAVFLFPVYDPYLGLTILGLI